MHRNSGVVHRSAVAGRARISELGQDRAAQQHVQLPVPLPPESARQLLEWLHVNESQPTAIVRWLFRELKGPSG